MDDERRRVKPQPCLNSQISLHHLPTIPPSPPSKQSGISSNATSTLHILNSIPPSLPAKAPPAPPAAPPVPAPNPAVINSSPSTSLSQLLSATSLPHTFAPAPAPKAPIPAWVPPAEERILCLLTRELYSSYAMAKLHVSMSWMMESLAAATSRERSSSAREGRRWSFESGGEKVPNPPTPGRNERPVMGRVRGERREMGRMAVVRKVGIDLWR
jgi:hypothetical protein